MILAEGNFSTKEDKEYAKRLRAKFDGKIDIKKAGKQGAFLIKVEGPDADKYYKAREGLSLATTHINLLYKSSLVTLTSSLEWFISSVLYDYFKKFPGQIDADAHCFSLNDFKSISSHSAAEEYLIEEKVSEVMFGAIEWIDYFRKHMKLSMSYVDSDLPRIVEVYQRRNILVHNNGVVNSTYMRNVDKGLREGIKQKDTLVIDPIYLDTSIELFERNFILVVAELWKKLDIDHIPRACALNKVSYKGLLDKHYLSSRAINKFSISDTKQPEHFRLMAQINYWLSYKLTGQFSEIEEEVKKTDYNAKSDQFVLALHALLEDDVNFFKLLRRMTIEEKAIKFEYLDEWPLFEGYRKTRRFQNVKKEYFKALESAKDV